jgi:hypothetical protein
MQISLKPHFAAMQKLAVPMQPRLAALLLLQGSLGTHTPRQPPQNLQQQQQQQQQQQR